MIDVILTCKNAENYIEECVDSILSQTYKQFNLFILDDCSEDDTIKKIRSFKDRRLQLIESKINIGTYAAKNLLLDNFVHSPYVALHDADDVSLPDRFDTQIKKFVCENSRLACIGTGVLEFWEMESFIPHTQSTHPVVKKTRINLYPEAINLNSFSNFNSDYMSVLKSKLCMNGTVMFRTSALYEVGGWDGRTRFSGDSDLFIRLLGAGYTIENIQEVLYKRRFHETSLTLSQETGIKSELRKNYNESILTDVEKCVKGQLVKRDFFYPQIEYTVTQCVE